MTHLPRAMLIDMDDTILSAYGRPEIAWHNVAVGIRRRVRAVDLATGGDRGSGFRAQILGRCRGAEWRLKLDEARRITVMSGFAALAAGGHTLPEDLAVRLANRFTAYREEEMFVFPGAHDAIDELKARGVKLALVTNGAAGAQRAKVERFALSRPLRSHPDRGRARFRQAGRARLSARHADARRHRIRDLDDRRQSGMEVVAPQRLGIYAIWIDVHGDGLPPDSTVKPDRIIRSLTELLPREP